jgi:mono/diheme cytochrome c family protein
MRLLKRLATIVVILVVLAAIVVGGLWKASDGPLSTRVALAALTFSAEGGDIARGAHFATGVLGCTECHGVNLSGGPVTKDAGFGIIYAPNLTSGAGGAAARYSDTDFERAIRHGIRPDGTRMLIMPSTAYAVLSDADLRDVVAYLRHAPAIGNTTPARKIGPIGRMLLLTGKMPFPADAIDQTATHPATQPPALDAAYGRYLAHIGGCFDCHGVNLAGGHFQGPPDAPPAMNITPAAIGTWTLADFERTIRTGRDPSGRTLDPFMPWRTMGRMTDDEFNALYGFIHSVPPVTAAAK